MKEKQLSLNQTHITTNLQPTYNIPTQSRKPTSLQPPSTYNLHTNLKHFFQSPWTGILLPAHENLNLCSSRAQQIRIKIKIVSILTVKTSIH